MISKATILQRSLANKIAMARATTRSAPSTSSLSSSMMSTFSQNKDSSSSSPSLSSLPNSRRHKSTQLSYIKEELEEEEDTGVKDMMNFPSSSTKQGPGESNEEPVLLNSKEHAVGYLNRILNANVYDAAVETQLQHAKSLSKVRFCYYNDYL